MYIYIYVSNYIFIHRHTYYSITTSSIHFLNILQRLSRKNGEHRGFGAFAKPCWHRAAPKPPWPRRDPPGMTQLPLEPWWLHHLVGKWWLLVPPGWKMLFYVVFFLGLLEGFFLRFTASWVDNVKDSECEMKTQLILELKKGRSCPSI